MKTLDKNKIFFEDKKKGLKIIKDDFIKTPCIESNSVDLIVTSPPYNVDIKYNSHKDDVSHEDYLNFTKDWLTKAFQLSKDDGRLCLNIALDKNKGGQQSVYSDILQVAKQVGWRYHSTIIWNEGNISRRTAWGSYLSASAPYVIAPVEVIIVLYKNKWKKESKGTSTIKRDEFIGWTNGIWTFNGESKKKIGHPAPFPIELPKRCMKLFSFKNDVILDPFLGSGTTLVSCIQENRQGIGVDFDNDYCEIAKKRLKSAIEESQQTKIN
ncbi:site-specific DNA-methyltransferase [Candidatus Woesearchaeota archaeon]|nr:site-specific DNA-methyltransferase [Candidatus Woesearchaeota archaeon]